MKIEEKFQNALDKFVEKTKKNKNIVGILVTGSFVHSVLHKNSDLDVFVILKDGIIRERGNTWIDGVEVEYFMNPVKQIEYYFGEEAGRGGPHTCHMFANSKVLFRRGDDVNKLIKEAKKIINKDRDKMGNVSKELAKYHLDDLEKDLEDVYVSGDDFAFRQVAMNVLDVSLDSFLQITRTYEEKHKRLEKYLKSKDVKFYGLYKKALVEDNMKKKYVNLVKLINYVEGKFDGKRPKEWKLRSKCTYLK